MKRFAWIVVLLIITLFLVPVVSADWLTDLWEDDPSPLTNPSLTWEEPAGGYGLPWYSVEDWEVDVCTRGLTTSLGYDPASNNIVSYFLATPIYKDTITLLAKKRITDALTYYEIGWYVQPYEGEYEVNITLMDKDGNERHLLATGTASKEMAYDGYIAFPVPCDEVYSNCPPDNGNLTRVRLAWRAGPDATLQHLTSTFVVVNETNQ